MVDHPSKRDLAGEQGDDARKSAINDALQPLATSMEEDDAYPPNHDSLPPTEPLVAPTSPTSTAVENTSNAQEIAEKAASEDAMDDDEANADDDSNPPTSSSLRLAAAEIAAAAAVAKPAASAAPLVNSTPPTGASTSPAPAPLTGAANPKPPNPPAPLRARRKTHFISPSQLQAAGFSRASEFTSSGTAEIKKKSSPLTASPALNLPPQQLPHHLPNPPQPSTKNLPSDTPLESSAPNTGNIPTENLHNVCYVLTARMDIYENKVVNGVSQCKLKAIASSFIS